MWAGSSRSNAWAHWAEQLAGWRDATGSNLYEHLAGVNNPSWEAGRTGAACFPCNPTLFLRGYGTSIGAAHAHQKLLLGQIS
jgi:hypothetical protein